MEKIALRKSTWMHGLEEIIVRSWWVFALFFICLLSYEQGQAKKHAIYNELKEQFQQLKIKKEKELNLNSQLRLEINSQSDPAWVELSLMKGLGVVPENQIKVYFSHERVE